MMDSETIGIIAAALASILGGQKLWEFLRARAELRAASDDKKAIGVGLYRDGLEAKIEALENDIKAANAKILDLTEKCARLETKLNFLESLNKAYKKRLDARAGDKDKSKSSTPTLQNALDALSWDEGDEDEEQAADEDKED